MPKPFSAVYELFFEPGEIVEIRGLGLVGKSRDWEGYARKNDVVSGYFDNAEDFAHAAQALDERKARGVYFTINPTDPSLIARANNRLIASPKATTTDQNIKCLRWLPIDLDPDRPSEISATDVELESAKNVGKAIVTWLEAGDLKFPAGIRAGSGNGYHIMYRLPDLPNDDEHRALVERAVRAIEAVFHNETVKVDLKVFNPSRIWKLYGTTGRKGDSTKERPHRKSYLFADQPTTLADVPVMTIEQLRKLAALAPVDESRAAAPPPSRYSRTTGKTEPMKGGDLGTLDVGKYLEHYGIRYSIKGKGIITLYRLEHCVFDPNHKQNEAAICASPAPPFLTYQCFHDSCNKRTWKEARAEISGSDSLAPFCANYDPNWKAPTQMGSGMLKKIEMAPTKSDVIIEGSMMPHPHEIDYAEFFEKKGKRATFVPRFMANYLLAYLQNIVYTDGIYWRYEKGVWRTFSKDLLEKICVIALKDQIQAHWIENSMRVFKGLVTKIEQDWPQETRYINCMNGMLDLKEGSLIAHHPEFWSRIQINANFNLEADSDRWDQFLEEVFPEDAKKKEGELGKADMLQQFFGYCLLPDCRFQKAMFLYGVGANGKSTALDSLIQVLGRDNTSSLSISDLGQRFKTQFLQGKMINIATETNTRDPIATEIFKAAIRGDGITAERKYGEPYMFNPTAKWLIAMNEAPVIPDKTYGFTRSVIVLEFKRRFKGKEIDPYLPEKLAAERDGIFTWAVFGLERVLKNNGFDLPGVVERESQEFMKTLNPVLLFAEEQLIVGPKQEVGTTEIYDEYKKWCSDGGNRPLSRNKFQDQILMNFPSVTKERIREGGINKRGFRGIGIRERIE